MNKSCSNKQISISSQNYAQRNSKCCEILKYSQVYKPTEV